MTDEEFAAQVRESFRNLQRLFAEADSRGLNACLVPTGLSIQNPLMRAPDVVTRVQLTNLEVYISRRL